MPLYLWSPEALDGDIVIPSVHEMIDLILFLFFLRILSKRSNHSVLVKNVSSFIVLECVIERVNNIVYEIPESLIIVDAIEVVINIFEGSQRNCSKVLVVELIVSIRWVK